MIVSDVVEVSSGIERERKERDWFVKSVRLIIMARCFQREENEMPGEKEKEKRFSFASILIRRDLLNFGKLSSGLSKTHCAKKSRQVVVVVVLQEQQL